MKKTILILLFTILSLVSFGQTYYKAYVTEMYEYNTSTKDWVLNTKNSDMNIVIVVEEQFLTIQAKSPSMFKVFSESGQEIKTKKLIGYRYDARDLRKEISVVIDIVRSVDESVSLISIINKTEGYNLRFYITPMEN